MKEEMKNNKKPSQSSEKYLIEDQFEDEEIVEEEDEDSLSISYGVTDRTIQQLDAYRSDKFLYLPPFQRTMVWDDKRKSKFIDSILRGLPMPSLFFYDDKKNIGSVFSERYFVVDGYQRLTAIFEFLDNKLKLTRTKHISKEWSSKTFDQLSAELQRRFKYTTLPVTLFHQINKKSNASLSLIFERINTGSVPLGSQEIREAVYYSEYVKEAVRKFDDKREWLELTTPRFCKKWNESKEDIEEFSKKFPKDLYNRREYYLRFFAIREAYNDKKLGRSTYQGLAKMLDSYLSDIVEMDSKKIQDKIEQDKELFNNTIDYIYNNISKNAFKSVSKNEDNSIEFNERIHSTIMDSLMVATTLAVEKNLKPTTFVLESVYYDIIENEFEDVSSNPFRVQTMTMENIEKRVDLMLRKIYGFKL